MFWDIKLDILRFLKGYDYLFISLFLRNTLIFKNNSISAKKLLMTLSELLKAYPVLMIMLHKPLKCWNSQLPLLHEMLPENHGKLIHPWTMKGCFLKMDSSDTGLHLCFNWNAFGQKFVVIWLLACKHMTLNIWLGAIISSFWSTVTLWCVTRCNDLMVWHDELFTPHRKSNGFSLHWL